MPGLSLTRHLSRYAISGLLRPASGEIGHGGVTFLGGHLAMDHAHRVPETRPQGRKPRLRRRQVREL